MGRLDLYERAVAGHMTGMSRKARKSSDIAGLGLHLQLYSVKRNWNLFSWQKLTSFLIL